MNVLSLFDGKYEVTEDGRIFSNVGKRKEMIGKITNCGYRMVVLNVNGKKLYPLLHRLIAEAFIPNPNNLPEVNHKDGNKLNNSVDNLEWVTTKQNLIHARDKGLLPTTKINMDIANRIRELYKTEKYSHNELGALFGLKHSQIGYIIQNKRWCV